MVVVADMQERIRRAVAKGMGSPDEIKQRILTQWPEEELVSRADYLLFNTGSPDELRAGTKRLFIRLLRAAEEACGHP